MSTSQRSWELKGTTLSYKIDGTLVATIAGVSSDIAVTTDGQITDGSVETYTDSDGTIVFKLANAALNNANVTLANKSKTYSFKLALGNDVQGVSIDSADWDSSKIASAGTAYLKGSLTAGYTLKSNTSIVHSNATTGTIFATITGLNKTGAIVEGMTDSNENELTPTITLNGNTITLEKDALTNANVKLTNTNGGAYSLALKSSGDGKVPTATTTTNIFALGATTTYKTVNTAYYTATNSTNIAYTAQKDIATLATIKGLAKTPAEGSVIADDSTGVITLGSGALTTGNVSITLPKNATKEYTLALDEDVDELDFGTLTPTAAVKNDKTTGSVTVTATITAGYLPTTDGKSVIYRKPKIAGTAETIATIKGLATGKSADEVTGAIEFDDMDDYGNIKVTLGAEALGTSNVTVTATGSGASYALDFDRSEVVDDTDPVVEKGVDVWRINGTTATYKTVIPAYYSYDATKNTIVYHKETELGVLAVVKGISGNLTVVDEPETDSEGNVTGITSKIVDADEKEVIKLDTSSTSSKVITLTGGFDNDGKPTGALTTTSVTFDTKKTGSEYMLALNETEGSLAPKLATDPKYTWSVSGSATKTATLKGEMDPGFTVSGDKKTITYTAAKTGNKAVVLATISGLDKTVTAKDGVLGTGSGNNFVSAEVAEPSFDKVITLNDKVLGASNVVIAGNYGYKLGTPDGVLNATDAKTASRDSENWFWSFDKTTGTATYSQYTPEYYTLDSAGNAISYAEEAATKTLATVTGLARNLVVSDDGKSLGVWGKKYNEETKKNEDFFYDYVTIDDSGSGGTITLETEDALNKEDVAVTSASGYSYKLELGNDAKVDTPTDFLKFDLSGTTATLKKGKNAGYKLHSSVLEYSAEDEGTIVATVTGLKSGLKLSDLEPKTDAEGNQYYINHIGVTAKDEEGKTYITDGLTVGTVDNENKKGEVVSTGNPALILTADVLSTGTVKVSGTGGYQLSVTDEGHVLSPNSQYVTAWKSNGNTAILVPYTAEKWTETTTSATINKVSVADAVYEVKYTAASKGETLATVTGLNGKDLSVDNSTGQIKGIDTTDVTFAEDNGKVTYSGNIVLSNNVLNKTDVIVKNEDGTKLASDVALKLGSDVTATSKMENDGGKYDSSKHNYVYTETITGTGYDDTDNSGNILYRVAGKGTATISNVNEGAVTFDNGVFTIDTTKVYEKNDVPQTVTLTLSGKYNGGYTLGLDEDTAVKSTYNFAKDANKTAATYNRIDEGFSLAANAKSITYANDKKTVLATISGLDKNVKLDSDGNIIETTTTTDANTGETTTETTVKGKGITLSTDPETGDQIFTLDKAVLGQNNITLGKNDKFSLAINATDCAPDTVSPTLYVSKGTATIKEGTSEGWTLTAAKTITYSKEKLTTRATISGLSAKLTDEQIADINFDESNKTITFGAKALDGAKKLTLKDGTISDYKLALNQTSDVIPTAYDTPKWTFSKGKAVLQDGTSAGWVATNSKTLTLQAAKLTNVATVTGLPNNLVEKGGKLYFPTTETVDGKKVTVADTEKGEALTFTPATYDSNGNLKTVGTIEVSAALIEAGTDVLDKSKGTTYLKKLALGAKDDYVFTFTDDAKLKQPEKDAPVATITGNGIVEYKQEAGDGYVLADKSVTYTKATTNTLAKITGLSATIFKKSSNADENDILLDDPDNDNKNVATAYDGEKKIIEFDNDKKTITLYEEALDGITKNGAKVTLTSNDYALKLGNDVTTPIELESPKWTVSGTTATLKEGTSEGWNATSDKVLTYTTETADSTVAVIKGLAKTVSKKLDKETGKIEGISVYPSLKTIALSSEVLGTTDITLNADSEYSFDTSDLKKPSSDEPQWTVSKGTATLKQNITAGFTPTVDGKTLTYTAEKNGLVLATVTGLNTSYDYASNQSALVLDPDSKTITVDKDALTNKKVAIKEKNSGYTLVLGNNAPTMEQTVTEWVTSGTTATYKTYTPAYYKKNNSTGAIDYTAESKPTHTYLTITGLAKNATIDAKSFDENNKVIKLRDAQVGTSNITLKDGEYKDYTLDITYIDENNKTKHVNNDEGWVNNNGTATLKGTLTKGFTLAANGKSATYLKADKTNQTFATITGLDKDATITADEDGVVTLDDKSMLTSKNVKLTNSNNSTYTLALADDVKASHVLDKNSDDSTFREEYDTATWTTKSGTATLKGVVSEGWKLTDSNNITYTKATATKNTKIDGTDTKIYTPQVLATVSGLVSGASIAADANADANDTTIELEAKQLTSKVTISDTKGYYDFEFASDYNNSSIIGSAGADSITVEGTNMTVSLGKGNDYVDFGNHGNTFVYGNGDGNDVIADFTVNNDKVKITSGKTITLTNEGNDTVIKVDKGSITLKGKTLSSFVYYDNNNNPVALTASADLMESDNFITSDSQLDELTGNYTNNALGDLNETQDLTGSNLTTLTKQSSLITYGGNKDK